MADHHYPYRLTLLQRRLFVLLLAEQKRVDAPPRRLTSMQLSRMLRPAQSERTVHKALQSLQFKLPLLQPSRSWRLHDGKEPGIRGEVWWVALSPKAKEQRDQEAER